MLAIRMFAIVLGTLALAAFQSDSLRSTQSQTRDTATVTRAQMLPTPLTDTDQSKIRQISTSEWLGPLAPIAISPFFGITCLAAISQFGGDYLPLNEFVSSNPALQSQVVFWVFLVLTLLTSLPRMTKVSKPFAQAMDQLEAYAGIITIIVLRFMVAPPEASEPVAIMQMGVLSFSADLILSVAAVINIIVINSIKFFFEILVWLIPIPFVDAILELGNKSICAALMAIYAWSPLVATVINIMIFAACAWAFNWVGRRIRLMRTMLTEPLWATLFPSYGKLTESNLSVFLKSGVENLPAKAHVRLETTDQGWRLTERRWLWGDRILELDADHYRFELQQGMFVNVIHAVPLRQSATPEGEPVAAGETETIELYLSRRFNHDLSSVMEKFSFVRQDQAPSEVALEM